MATIEERIKQSRFRSERHKTIVSILFTANLLNAHFEEAFKKYGITVQQFNVLRILRGQQPNPCTVNLIRERMLDKMSDASRIVERLRKAGLIERVQSKRDRRAVDVIITQKGLLLLAQMDKAEDKMNSPLNSITEEEARQLNSLLEKVINGFD
ncbi:MAG: MarR family transcriptional regulator [Chitinophagales bacterium]|nr:MarR family transcriptional regulator [Chitinophagales bacterium]